MSGIAVLPPCCSCLATGNSRHVLVVTDTLVCSRGQSGVGCQRALAQHLQGNALLSLSELVNSRLAFFAKYQMHHQQEQLCTCLQHATGMHCLRQLRFFHTALHNSEPYSVQL
jgi:hypothetical protein